MPAEINPVSGLPMIEVDGVWRTLGCLPPHKMSALPNWSDEKPVLGAGEYRERNFRDTFPIVTVEDQAATESCVGHAVDSVFTYSWLQGGLLYKRFSPTYVYGLINGGVDQGAVISDAMTAIKMYGICEASYVPEGMIYRSQFPAESFANARRYRAVEVLQCRSYRDMCSAISLGFAVVSGIYIGDNFGNLESDGLAPLPNRIIGGHALSHIGLKWSAQRNAWLILTQNSWGKKWGMRDATGTGGFCYLSEAHWNNMRIDAWAIVGVFNDPEDPNDDIPIAR